MSGKFALIIGNTEYTDPGLAQLTAPGKDAEDFARVLKDKEIGAFDNVKVIVNEPSASVIEAIDEFFDQKKHDDMLVLYFSGHGIKDEIGSLYLAFKNTIRSRLRATAIKSDYIREAMDQSRSKRQVVILDCCNSGAFPPGTKAEVGGAMGLTTAFQGYGRFVLTASNAIQFAWDSGQLIGETKNSLFTHFLVKGLEGEADSDGDGRITVDELYDYTYDQISRVTPNQTPTKSAAKQEGEIVLRQSTRIENIKPVSLPDEIIEAIEDTRPFVREVTVQQLEKLLKGKNLGLARSAREALEKIADQDDSRRVAQTALKALESIRQAEQLAAQRVQEEKQIREQAELLAAQKAEEERIAHEREKEERRAREELERRVREKVEAEWKAQEEAKRLASQKAEEERLAREQAEAEREAARLKAAREAAEKLAKEKAEQEAMELAARRKAEREAAEVVKLANPQPTSRQRPILTWSIIGIIGLCVVVAGAWGISSYLASLGGPPAATAVPATTESPAMTEVPPAATGAPAASTAACAPNCTYADMTIGFLQTGSEGGWRAANTASFKETAEQLGINLKFYDSQNDLAKQVAGFQQFIEDPEVNVIAISPLEAAGWEQVLKDAQAAGKPVILSDRRIDGNEDLYVTFVGADFVEEGRKSGTEMCKLLEGSEKKNVWELVGNVGSSPALDRGKGFRETAAECGIVVTNSQTGNWSIVEGKQVTEAWLKESQDVQGIFGQNDEMAFGAIEALKEAGLEPAVDVKIISVDATAGAFQAMLDGTLNVTVECNPLIAPQVYEAALAAMNGETLPKWIPSIEGVFYMDDPNLVEIAAGRTY